MENKKTINKQKRVPPTKVVAEKTWKPSSTVNESSEELDEIYRSSELFFPYIHAKVARFIAEFEKDHAEWRARFLAIGKERK